MVGWVCVERQYAVFPSPGETVPAVSTTSHHHQTRDMKNVVLITVDSLRADYILGPKAPESLETLPHLADRGIRFSNAFANAPYTKASFLSILSGTYPWMFESVQGGFGADRPHIANFLADAGYGTAGFHTNTYLSPTYNYDRGFDHYLGRDTGDSIGKGNATTTVVNELIEKAVSVPTLSDVIHRIYSSAGKYLGIQLGSHIYKPAEELNAAVLEWSRRQTQPVFLWIHYMDVHNPYYPHDGTVSEGISGRRAVKLFHRVNELRGDSPEDDIETLERLYRGEIEYLDHELNRLFEGLNQTLDMGNTLVAFTSDHGEAFNEQGHVFHPGSALYDENVHIPMIVSGPDVGQGTVETPVSNVDLVPTVLSQVGLDPPASTVGVDVTEFLERDPGKRHVFAEAYSQTDGHAMVTDGTHKLIRHLETGEVELIDRRKSMEHSQVYDGEYPDVREELEAALDDHIREVGQSRQVGKAVEVPESVRLQLRKLGYDE